MVTAIRIPDLGTNTDEVTLVEWLKQEGDTVKRGEPLCEVETDKAVMEYQATNAGALLKMIKAPGQSARVGEPIGIIGQPGEDIAELLAQTDTTPPPTQQAQAAPPQAAPPQPAEAAPQTAPAEAPPAEPSPSDVPSPEGAPAEGEPAEAPPELPNFEELADPEVAERLKLTPDQRERIAELLKERKEKLAAASEAEATEEERQAILQGILEAIA